MNVIENYVAMACRTESNDFDAIRDRLTVNMTRLLHAGIGMSTEAGEFIDQLKKHIFYGRELQPDNLVEELGDLMWYVAVAISAVNARMGWNLTLSDVLTANIEKLRRRYPSQFTEEEANMRDVDAEMSVLRDALGNVSDAGHAVAASFTTLRREVAMVDASKLQELMDESLTREQIVRRLRDLLATPVMRLRDLSMPVIDAGEAKEAEDLPFIDPLEE